MGRVGRRAPYLPPLRWSLTPLHVSWQGTAPRPPVPCPCWSLVLWLLLPGSETCCCPQPGTLCTLCALHLRPRRSWLGKGSSLDCGTCSKHFLGCTGSWGHFLAQCSDAGMLPEEPHRGALFRAHQSSQRDDSQHPSAQAPQETWSGFGVSIPSPVFTVLQDFCV